MELQQLREMDACPDVMLDVMEIAASNVSAKKDQIEPILVASMPDHDKPVLVPTAAFEVVGRLKGIGEKQAISCLMAALVKRGATEVVYASEAWLRKLGENEPVPDTLRDDPEADDVVVVIHSDEAGDTIAYGRIESTAWGDRFVADWEIEKGASCGTLANTFARVRGEVE